MENRGVADSYATGLRRSLLLSLAAGMLAAILATGTRLAGWAYGGSVAPPPSPEISPTAARSLQEKIRLLSMPPSKAARLDPVVVTEAETNSYLKYNGHEFLPPGVDDAAIHIARDHISGTADVDFRVLEQASKSDDWGARMLAMAFQGKQRLSAVGRLETGGGQGKVTIQDVRVGTWAVPDALTSFLLENYVQKRYRIDISKPLNLPDHVTRIELGSGNATFYRSSNKIRN